MTKVKKSQNKKEPTYEIADWFLRTLVSIVTGNDLAIPITLNVGGFLVSGLLVSGHKYFESIEDQWVKMTKDEAAAKLLKGQLKNLGDTWYKKHIKPGRPIEDKRTQHIHLKDAKIFHPGGQPVPTNKGIWWRGRLESVDGFIHGTLATG